MNINRYHIKSPSEVSTVNLSIPPDYKKQCIDETYKLQDQKNIFTNVNAIRSSYEVWKETKVFNPLIDRILETISKIYPILDSRFKEYNLINCWSVIYKTGHHANLHHHLPCHLSFVYYLKSNPTSSPLVFDKSDFYITPKDDMLIIFPSYLYHFVPKHEGKEDRICIAGNLDLISNP